MRSPSLRATPPRPPGPPSAETLFLPGSNRSLPDPSLGEGTIFSLPSASQISSPSQGSGKQNPETSPKRKRGLASVPPEPRALSQGRSGPGHLEVPDEGPDWGWGWNALWWPGRRPVWKGARLGAGTERHPGLARRQRRRRARFARLGFVRWG